MTGGISDIATISLTASARMAVLPDPVMEDSAW